MPTALWNDRVVAESEQFEEVEGNIYFPPEAGAAERAHHRVRLEGHPALF